MLDPLRSGAVLFFVLTLICGVAYPLAVTAAASVAFSENAAGNLVRGHDGGIRGSRLIGQLWTSERYFHGRPSACNYDASASSGSNLGPMNGVLKAAIDERAAALKAESSAPIPPDLLTSSASGLDPHVTLEAAYWQIPRVAKARGLPEGQLKELVDTQIHSRDLGLFPRINVFELNLALDGL